MAADPKLPGRFRAAIQDPANELLLSVVSVWEAVIKYQLGKLPLPSPPAQYMVRQRVIHAIATLPVDEAAMPYLAQLPSIHNDPFDRLLIAQALQHGLTLVTVDADVADVAAYPVPTLA